MLEAVEKLGYRPNPIARALMTRRTGLVGFWMSLQYSRYRSQVLDRMRDVLGQTELALAVTDVDEQYHWDHSFARSLRVPVEGIIAFDASGSIDAFGLDSKRLAPEIPFVSMGAYWSEVRSFVGVDLRFGATEAMTHLLETGRRRIAYFAPWNSDLLTEGFRYEVYRDMMDQAGLPCEIISAKGVTPLSVQESLSALESLPEAIFCMNDDLAIAASVAIGRMGLKVGADVALVGFDGIEETEHCPVPITTVKQPINEMCTLTFEFLRSQMEDPEAPLRQQILKPTLVIRDSSKG